DGSEIGTLIGKLLAGVLELGATLIDRILGAVVVALLVEGVVELLLSAEHGALGGGDSILGVATLELQAARVFLVALAYAHLGLGVGADDLGDGIVVVQADEQIAALHLVVEVDGNVDDAAADLGGNAHLAALGLDAAGGRSGPRRLHGGGGVVVAVVRRLGAVVGRRRLGGLLLGD